jgi:hypothetical protein
MICLIKGYELFEWHTAVKNGFECNRKQKFEKKEEFCMKDRMMLGEKDFQKAVLIVVLLLVTLVCLHLFVARSDAAEMSNTFTNTLSAERHVLIHEGEVRSTNHQIIVT